MAYKFFLVAALAIAASAQHEHYAHEEYNDHPKYEFAYDVKDEHTGDVHSQHESRDGEVTKGFYSLIDADGYKRTVEYTVDGKSGFNAVVHREPTGRAPAPAATPKHQAPQYHAPQYQGQQVHQAPQAHQASQVSQDSHAHQAPQVFQAPHAQQVYQVPKIQMLPQMHQAPQVQKATHVLIAPQMHQEARQQVPIY